jgi:hypothetical protein
MSNTEPWTIQSDKKNNLIASLLFIFFGIIFFVVYKISSNPDARYLLGISLFCITLGPLIYYLDEEVLTIIDPKQNRLQIQYKNRFKVRNKNIHFKEIENIEIKTMNRHKDHVVKLHILRIKLKNGERLRLGKESLEQADLESIGEKLALEIGCKLETDTPDGPVNLSYVPLALLGSIAIYAFWYRVTVGRWCPAMWGGTAPILIIIFSFISLMKISTYRK